MESDDDAEQVFRLWRVRRTLMQLCRSRGYMVSDAEHDMDQASFEARFGSHPSQNHPNRSDLNVVVENGGELRLGIFFPDDIKVGIGAVRAVIDQMKECELKSAIVVVRSGMTPSARKALAESSSLNLLVQSFEESELVVNITHHELVPKHEVLTPAEKKELLELYKLKEQQLPRIKRTDPVAKYYGLRLGQVVRITRPSPTAGRYVTYRMVH